MTKNKLLEEVTEDYEPPIRASSGDDGGAGNSIGERLARLETKMEHVALKEDVLNLKIWILGGVIGGIMSAVMITLGIVKDIF